MCHNVVVVNAKSSCGYYLYYYSYVSMLCSFYFTLIELTIGSTETNREDSSSSKEKVNGSYIYYYNYIYSLATKVFLGNDSWVKLCKTGVMDDFVLLQVECLPRFMQKGQSSFIII